MIDGHGEMEQGRVGPHVPGGLRPLIRLASRYVVDKSISRRQLRRLAVLTDTETEIGAFGGLLGAHGISIRTDDASESDERAAEGESEAWARADEPAEPDPAASTPELEAVLHQGAYATDPVARERAVSAARSVMSSDRVTPFSDDCTLTPQQEWGLFEILRDGMRPGQEISADLVRDLPRAGDPYRAWSTLVAHNTRLVWKLVERHTNRGLERGDLFQHGVIGLMTALRKFDVTRGNKLSTYAVHWIAQSIERGIYNEGTTIRVPVHVHDRFHKLRKAEEDLYAQGRRASREELRLATGCGPELVDFYIRYRSAPTSLDALVGDGVTLGDLVRDERTGVPGPEEALAPKFGRERVEGILSLLPEREARVLRYRIGVVDGEPWTLTRIGTEMGVTRERIRQLESRALGVIRERVADVERASSTEGDLSPGAVLDMAIARAGAGTAGEKSIRPVVEAQASPRGPVTEQGRRVLGLVRDPRYTLATSLAALVDDSLRAGAGTVRIDFSPSGGDSWVAVTSDGGRMSSSELRARMRLTGVGRHPGGRSGAPTSELVMASFAQARALTVLSLKDHGDPLTWTWDVSRVDESGQWRAGTTMDREAQRILDRLDLEGQGTVVLWRDVDRLGHGLTFWQQMQEAADELAVLFHRYLERGALRMFLSGRELAPCDPLLWLHPATQDRGLEVLEHDGAKITVNPVVLPHPSRLSSKGDGRVSAFPKLARREGFLIYVGDRLILSGGWLGLPGLDSSDKTSLARVAVTLSPEAAVTWCVDRASQEAHPPPPMARRLAALAEDVRDRSVRVFEKRRPVN